MAKVNKIPLQVMAVELLLQKAITSTSTLDGAIANVDKVLAWMEKLNGDSVQD